MMQEIKALERCEYNIIIEHVGKFNFSNKYSSSSAIRNNKIHKEILAPIFVHLLNHIHRNRSISANTLSSSAAAVVGCPAEEDNFREISQTNS